MDQPILITRRHFHALAGSAVAMAAASAFAQQPRAQSAAADGKASTKLATPRTIKCFTCDLNWVRTDRDSVRAAVAKDWAFVNPQEYFDYHREVGNNVMFLHAYTVGGFAFYPTKLGPVAPGSGSQLLPQIWALSRKARMPFMSYMCVGHDFGVQSRHPEWIVPGTTSLAPESGWTTLLCQRIREFLTQFPVEWMLFAWFFYGDASGDVAVQPASFVERPFREIVGRPMPAKANEITPQENLKYKREVLARQFRAIHDAIKETSPDTEMGFNVPYDKADEPLWRDHPMVNESEMIVTECTNKDVMEWRFAFASQSSE